MEDVEAAISVSLMETPCSCWISQYDFMTIGLDAVDKAPWPIQYFATYHPSEIEMSKERRRVQGGNVDYRVISHVQFQSSGTDKKDLVDFIVGFEPPSGSSSLLGVLAGIKMGYQKIILCGCPLIGENGKGYDYAKFREGWTAKLDAIRQTTRSMSGWTKELLGAPSEPWLVAGE